VDCVIVGAGAAGLTAAADLARRDVRVAIVEARDRIGGRIHTIRPPGPGLPLELGAEYVHGDEEESFALSQLAGAPLCKVMGSQFHFFRGRLVALPDFDERLKKVMQGLPRAGRRQSFLDYLNAHFPAGKRYALERSLALGFVQGFDAARPEVVSAKSLAEEADESGQEQYRIVGGYDRLLEPFVEALKPGVADVHLNRVVTEVQWKARRVRLVMKPGMEMEARCALITLPLGVWQAPAGAEGSIRFTPVLESKSAAAAKLAVGPVIKILVTFEEPFWMEHKPWKHDLSELSFIHSVDQPIPVWWTGMPLRSAMLTGWCGGPRAEKLANKPVGFIREKAMESLAKMLAFPRKKLESLVRSVHVADWQADPFARGAYSYQPVGAEGAAKELARSEKATLFFAGEAAHTEGPSGTVPAAIASGHRAAKEILKALGVKD